MRDLSEEELEATLFALRRLEDRYQKLCGSDSPLSGAAEEALERIRAARSKLDPNEPREEAAPEVEKGEFIYLYLPDGIRDKELEDELDSRIPNTNDPEADSFFWSNKFDNFVIRSKFARETEEAVKERYGGDVELDRDPDWARKPNTWQIRRKDSRKGSRERPSTS